ncbi:hypothetical protein ACP70R_008052 [Stipagrostis hirtigluma subsp. patula]
MNGVKRVILLGRCLADGGSAAPAGVAWRGTAREETEGVTDHAAMPPPGASSFLRAASGPSPREPRGRMGGELVGCRSQPQLIWRRSRGSPARRARAVLTGGEGAFHFQSNSPLSEFVMSAIIWLVLFLASQRRRLASCVLAYGRRGGARGCAPSARRFPTTRIAETAMAAASQQFKTALASAPASQLPDFTQPSIGECDASGTNRLRRSQTPVSGI